MIQVYTQEKQGNEWLQRYRGASAALVCVLGFTETGLIPGISAAGSTPHARRYTAIADAEFLYNGPQPRPQYPLPPLAAGASPVFISRAIVEALGLPIYLFNAGLPQLPSVPTIDLGGAAAQCLSRGCAMKLATVKHLWEQGILWGEQLARQPQDYVILGECVVGGTTTALAVLTGLGIAAAGKVNSSHPVCNHAQKWTLVKLGLQRAHLWDKIPLQDPLVLIAAVGDPMQIAVAGMAIALSRSQGVLLAGGTQMLAVYALMHALGKAFEIAWQPEAVVVGTTRWVAEDPTGNTVELAQLIGGVLLGTKLSFKNSRYPQLQVYEQGYVKEGVAAGGCCIAACLMQNWHQAQLLQTIEGLLERYSKAVGF
ncbi:nicotinate mononucleotide-dependent phosphoribosyltransferase CobT [Chroococcidiopsis sp. TS-821]|uniref:nicotinate mononucleotide-dependent phosphoribosyltransferase CobT n=1 Tax=Chroococcidiopsis sp. TS-821 TaxID=1378066 RepID=UPI000CEEE695|nr:TIGR00303 family protein [Chroococcidiopsis sp. TS-821]PPS39125.1 TIGR00303 family protein [Chroococcidiopsis sp. TS-821]